jgi:hypothetical protein
VEKAAVMLVGVSVGYKESTNCRLEAQYGMSRQKAMIPLLLERGYQPDGWLGMLMGTKLWHPSPPPPPPRPRELPNALARNDPSTKLSLHLAQSVRAVPCRKGRILDRGHLAAARSSGHGVWTQHHLRQVRPLRHDA